MLTTLPKQELHFRGQSKISHWILSFKQQACVVTFVWKEHILFAMESFAKLQPNLKMWSKIFTIHWIFFNKRSVLQ